MAHSDGRAFVTFWALHSHLSRRRRLGSSVLDWSVRLRIRDHAHSPGISSPRFSPPRGVGERLQESGVRRGAVTNGRLYDWFLHSRNEPAVPPGIGGCAASDFANLSA